MAYPDGTGDAVATSRRCGRPRSVSDEVVGRILELRAEGLGFHSVARQLEQEDHPTGQGGRRWDGTTVRRVLISRSLYDGRPPGSPQPHITLARLRAQIRALK
jgi:hypothetical protein